MPGRHVAPAGSPARDPAHAKVGRHADMAPFHRTAAIAAHLAAADTADRAAAIAAYLAAAIATYLAATVAAYLAATVATHFSPMIAANAGSMIAANARGMITSRGSRMKAPAAPVSKSWAAVGGNRRRDHEQERVTIHRLLLHQTGRGFLVAPAPLAQRQSSVVTAIT